MKKLFHLLMILLGAASSSPAQSLAPAQPVPKDIWGHWVVTSQPAATTIWCWGEAEPKKLIGTELAYSAQSFRWKNVRAEDPTATTRTLTAQQFHDENSGGGSKSAQVTLAQLGIKTDRVLEITISHPDASITGASTEIPGDTVLNKDKNTIIFPFAIYTSKPNVTPPFTNDLLGEFMSTQSHGDLDGKVALITGGTTGIGRDTAILFAKNGAKVVVSGRREAEGNETINLVRAAGGDGLFGKSDVSKSSDVQSLIQKTVETFGRLDLAFNNAGIEGQWKPIIEQSEQDWDSVININLKGIWLCLKYEILQMLKQGSPGAIVNMSSVAGLMGSAGAAIYVASKHGVIGLTRNAALECASKNIRVNAVCPAVVETAMADRAFADPQVSKRVLAMHPLGRFGKPSEIAEAVLWLCSDKSSFMTGHYITLDGGMLAGPNPNG